LVALGINCKMHWWSTSGSTLALLLSVQFFIYRHKTIPGHWGWPSKLLPLSEVSLALVLSGMNFLVAFCLGTEWSRGLAPCPESPR
jgi:hypothetical protein